MAILVKKPSDDPWTWLGPAYTVYHFQEDIFSDPDWRSYGLTENTGGTHIEGNGGQDIEIYGDGTNHNLRYFYKDLTETSSFVCSFNITGDALSRGSGVDNATSVGIVMKNILTGHLIHYGIILHPTMGPTTMIREYVQEQGATASVAYRAGPQMAVYGFPRVDIAENLILRVDRLTSSTSDLYISMDGVSFIKVQTYTHSPHNVTNLTYDSNRIGFGIDAVDNSHYAMGVDWVAHT